MKNPTLRPRFCITTDSHGAVVIDPNTINEIGNVAKQGFPVSIPPASPPITNIIGIWQPKMACAAMRTATFLLARSSLIASSVILLSFVDFKYH